MTVSASRVISDLGIEPINAAAGDPLAAPHPAEFARSPQSWLFAFASSELRRGELRSIELCGRRLAVFRGDDGECGAVAARCPHLGADLAAGRVVGTAVECPYHRFRFGRDGRCAGADLVTSAYPTAERFGAVFVFFGPRASFPLPSFGIDVELVTARPMHWRPDAQWYMVGANAFDARHFALAHDRHLRAAPQLSQPHPLALRVTYQYEIEGDRWVDRLVRAASGSTVQFEVTCWGGTVLLVRARFARDESFGVVAVRPNGTGTSSAEVHVLVSAARRPGRAWLADWLRAQAKRFAIGHMLRDDASNLRRLDYVHGGLRPGDETLAAYLRWAAAISESTPVENS